MWNSIGNVYIGANTDISQFLDERKMKGIYTKVSYYEETFKSGNIELKYHHYQAVLCYMCCSFKLASDVGHLRNLPSVQ